jgi:hypothetical protein
MLQNVEPIREQMAFICVLDEPGLVCFDLRLAQFQGVFNSKYGAIT